MKIGDLVKLEGHHQTGVVVDIVHKKAWRVHEKGVKVNWDTVEPEPHAIVMVDNDFMTRPSVDLDLIS